MDGDWTRVFLPEDGRTRVRHGNERVRWAAYATREAWETHAAHLRRRILVSAGLWPMPERMPLHPQVTGRIEHDEYTIENLYFESLPGFYVAGNLYRPKGKAAPYPGVACPHGHWEHGRLQDGELGSVPARCITLARLGCVAFAYDMVGYNDSGVQLGGGEGDHAHRLFFNRPQEHLWGISLMGLHLWNSIRVIDMLCSLPDVDAQRIACTGASGGGTQTFMLTAVDDRVRVSAPVNMISAHFQGGCLCENMPNLRLDCSNLDIGAMMAPRPMLMVSATGDWTRNTPEVEFPAIHGVYRLYGADDCVATIQVDAPHNYNRQSREAVYAWLGRWLLGEQDVERLKEQPYQMDAPEAMRVFTDGKLPPGAATAEQVNASLVAAAQAQIRALQPQDAATLHAYRELMGTAYRYALNAEQPHAADLDVQSVGTEPRGGKEQRDGWRLERLILGRKGVGERTPALLFVPAQQRGAVLVIHPEGKAALADGEGPGALVGALLARGWAVLAIDAFGTGELSQVRRDRSVDHFLTFNRSDAALRIQDILNGIAYLQPRAWTVHLVGVGAAGLWCLLARGLARGVAVTVVDAAQFDCDDDLAWVEGLFIPQIRRAGDVRTAAALIAPGRLLIHNAAATFPATWCEQAYGVAGVPQALRIERERAAAAAIADALDAR
jgi:dienelactone hydrolase